MTPHPDMAQRAVDCLLDTEQTLLPDDVAFAVACLIEEHAVVTPKAKRAVATIVNAYHEASLKPTTEE